MDKTEVPVFMVFTILLVLVFSIKIFHFKITPQCWGGRCYTPFKAIRSSCISHLVEFYFRSSKDGRTWMPSTTVSSLGPNQ